MKAQKFASTAAAFAAGILVTTPIMAHAETVADKPAPSEETSPIVESAPAPQKSLEEAEANVKTAQAEAKEAQADRDSKANEAASAKELANQTYVKLEEVKQVATQSQVNADASLVQVQAQSQAAAELAATIQVQADKNLADAEEKVAEAKAAQAAAQQEIEQAQATLAQAEANAPNAQALADAKKKQEQAQADKEAADKELEQRTTALEEAEVAKATAETEIEIATHAKDVAEADLAIAQNKVQEATTELQKAQELKQNLENDVAHQDLVDAAVQKVAQKENALEVARQEAQAKATELAAAEATLQQKQTELAEKEATLENARREKQLACDAANDKRQEVTKAEAANTAAKEALEQANQALLAANEKKAAADLKLEEALKIRDAAQAQQTSAAEIERYSKRGSLGLFEWLHAQTDLTPDQKADLLKAQEIINHGLNENVADWAPGHLDFSKKPMKGLDASGGKTATLAHERDAIALRNTMLVKDFFTAVEKYVASDDPYRRIFVEGLKKKLGVTELENGGVAMTTFSAIASAQLSADRNSFYLHHNPRWHFHGANGEVLSSAGRPQKDVELWNSEKEFYDAAATELGISVDTLTYSDDPNSDWMRLRKLAAQKGEVGHYEFFLFSSANVVMGYGATQFDAGQTAFFSTNGTAQSMWDKTGAMTFNQMRALLARYEAFLANAPQNQAELTAANQKVAQSQAEVQEAETKVQAATNTVAEKQQAMQTKTAELGKAQKALAGAEKTCAEKETAFSEAEAAVTQARIQITTAEGAKTTALEAKTKADQVVADTDSQLQQANAELTILRDKEQALADAAAKVVAAQAKVLEETTARDHAEAKALDAHDNLQAAQNALATKVSEINDAKQAKQTAQTKVEAATAALQVAEAALAPLTKTNAKLVEARQSVEDAKTVKAETDQAVVDAETVKAVAAQKAAEAKNAKEAAEAKQVVLQAVTSEKAAAGFEDALLQAYPELVDVAAKYMKAQEAKQAVALAEAKLTEAQEAYRIAAVHFVEADTRLHAAKAKLVAAEAEYRAILGITVDAPQFINPSAADPASCTVLPYATVTDLAGVTYTVTVDGKPVMAKAGKYEYPYGKTIVIKAEAENGIRFARDAQTEWSWTAIQAESCKQPQVKDPMIAKRTSEGMPLAEGRQAPYQRETKHRQLPATGLSANAGLSAGLLAAGMGFFVFGRLSRKRETN